MIVAAVVAAASLLVLAAQAQIPADPVAAAEFLVHYSGQGHCEEPEILAWSCNQPQCQNTMGTFSTTFYTTVKTGGHAYSAVNERQEAIFFVVRGTDNPRNTLQDARFLFTQLAGAPEGVEVHKGFYASWLDFEPQVIPQLELLRQAHPTFKIYTTGHSLGGAVAVMAAAHMHLLGWNVTSYSYGQPRVGNPAFAQWFQSVEPDAVRITAYNDCVPAFPPVAIGYEHHATEVWLQPDGRTGKLCDPNNGEDLTCFRSVPFADLDCDVHVTGYYDVNYGGVCYLDTPASQ